MKINLAELFKKQEQVLTVFQIDSNWLRLIQMKSLKREKKISMIKAVEIISLSDEEISSKVTELAFELKINSRYLILSIPRHLTTTRNLDLPSANPLEIKAEVGGLANRSTAGDPWAQDPNRP